jgi:hypothetical protein
MAMVHRPFHNLIEECVPVWQCEWHPVSFHALDIGNPTFGPDETTKLLQQTTFLQNFPQLVTTGTLSIAPISPQKRFCLAECIQVEKGICIGVTFVSSVPAGTTPLLTDPGGEGWVTFHFQKATQSLLKKAKMYEESSKFRLFRPTLGT